MRHIPIILLLLSIAGCGRDPAESIAPGDCQNGQSFAGRDLTGIWHLEVEVDPTYRFPFSMRMDRTESGYAVTLFRSSDYTVGLTGSSLAIEAVWTTPEGEQRSRTVRSCSLDIEGNLSGIYESCRAGDCITGSIRGRQLEPLAEPDAEGLTLLSEYNGSPAGAWRAGGEITYNVRVHEGIAYLARGGDGLRIVDVSDPSRPRERGHLAAPGADSGEYYNDIKITRDAQGGIFALMGSNLRGAVVIEVSDPDAPREVSAFPTPNETANGNPGVHSIFVEGPIAGPNGESVSAARAYLTYNNDGSLLVYDVSDPRAPVRIGSYSSPRLGNEGGFVHDLYVRAGRAYLNYWNLGMIIIDTADNPEQPTLVGEYRDYGGQTSHSSWVTRVGERTISLHGDEQYGAHVRVVDVGDESTDFLDTLGSYQTRPEVSVHNILASDNRVFVTYYQDGLRVLDVQDPTHPVEIGHFHTWPGPVAGYGSSFYEGAIGIDFDTASGTVYVADTHRGLFVLSMD